MTGRRSDLSGRPAGAPDVLAGLLDALRPSAPTYGRFELGAPWGFRLPSGDGAHLVVVGRGGARLEVAGLGRPIALSAGDLALLPHGGAHALSDAEGSSLEPLGEAACRRVRRAEPIRLGGAGARTSLVVGAFALRAAHRGLSVRRLSRAIHVPAKGPGAFPALSAAARLFFAESASRAPGAAAAMNRLADLLLVQAVRAFVVGGECGGRGLRALSDRAIGAALAAMHERPAEPWTVGRLSSAVAMSRSGFAARFHDLVGEPPREYLARFRMAEAARLLRETELGMAEVAERVGYRAEASFCKAFKRLEGVTPGAYRRARRPAAPGRAPLRETRPPPRSSGRVASSSRYRPFSRRIAS